LAGDVAGLVPGTGHGTAWSSVLAELREEPGVKLVRSGRADVWLASGHAEVPDGRPLVAQVHEAGWADPDLRRTLHPDFAAAMDAATGAAVRAAAHVITPSDAARRQVIEAYASAPEAVHAIPHGVDHRLFQPGGDRGRALVGGPYVLFVGVLHPRKNFAAVRAAVAALARAGYPQGLAIVGNPAADPDADAYLREASAELPGFAGRVRLFRELPTADVAALMASADAFCLPSLFEGFGLPALEAMACGAPVVVSDRGALPEVVADAGLIVDPDPEAVSDGILRIIGDPALADRLRSAGVARSADFSWKRTAAGWLDVLRSAV
jgi:glycosyltransferase involved in cell wall biosynthesis